MAKRLKLKMAKVIPSFRSCRSKDTSILPINPHPSLPSISTLNSNLHFSHPMNPLPSPPLPSQSTSSASDPKLIPQFQWRKEDKWYVVALVYDRSVHPHRKTCHSSISGASGFKYHVSEAPTLPCPSLSQKKKKHKKKQTKKTVLELRISSSSAESGLFNSESFGYTDDEETEALVSSSSSSEFNPRLKKNCRETSTPRRKKKRMAKKEVHSPGYESPARLSVFQRLIPCAVEGKVRESFAVVKKSENPYEDFKRSMIEMILEKEMSDQNDLEQLLHCLLSLNDKQHHGVIVEAFSEIWEALFCIRSSRPSV